MRAFTLTLALGATLLSSAATAATEVSVEARPSAIVRLSDLDLTSPIGKRLLARRLNGAIEQVCGSYAGVNDISEQMDIDDCRVVASASAERQLPARAARLAGRPTEIRLAFQQR